MAREMAMSLAAVVVSVAGFAAPVCAALPTQTVLLSGEQAPFAPAGVKVNFFNNPPVTALDNSGKVNILYAGFPYTPAPNFRDALIVGTTGSWTELARFNNSATETGVAGATWRGFGSLVSRTRSGQMLFNANINGPGIDFTPQGANNNSGVLMYHNGSSMTMIARNLDQVPGLPAGVTYFGLDDGAFRPTVNINNSGQMAINSYIRGTGIVGSSENVLLFRETSGAFTTVAQEQRATGIAGVNFNTIDGNRLNDNGQMVFRATLVSAPGNPFAVSPGVDDFSMWTATSSGKTMIARGGASIPGMAGRTWGNFSGAPGISNNGQVAFRGTMRGTGITEFDNDLALFRTSFNGASVTVLAQKGVAAPGTEAGTTFLQFGDALMSDNGDAVFSARLQGVSVTPDVNEYALYAHRGGVASVLARQNSQAVGAAAGVLYNYMFDAQVNASGAVAFTSLLKGAGVTNANNKAIFAEIAGSLTMVVREGDQLEVLPGVFKTIEALGTSSSLETTPPLFPSAGASDGLSRMWNDNGNLVYFAQFTDGTSGFFITPPVPAPGVGAGLALIGVLAARRRR